MTPIFASIDDVRLNFDESSLLVLAFVLAFIMFGIALDTRPADFRAVAREPKAMTVGILAQFIALPAITFTLTLVLGVGPSIALGMILIACCPPGNVSNILTYRSGGNVALSVSMTVISNLLAIFLMPLNIAFWGGIHPEASQILTAIELDAIEMLLDIAIVIAIPFALGLSIANRFPAFAAKVQPTVKRISLLALVAFIVVALFGNFENFKDYFLVVLVAVVIHDTLALGLGYGIAAGFKVSEYNRRPITFEVGVRNAGLGLGIIFSFFDGLGGMAMVAGVWGIWDIIAGLGLASWWARRGGGSPDSGQAPEPREA
ncbi:MAG: bile acid:sodium symporter family protein [Solirubrobacterales bacterium]